MLTSEGITPSIQLTPSPPQVEEQEGDEPLSVVERKVARRQPHCKTRMECLEQCIDTLTELISTLVVALGQNVFNVALTIPLGSILLTRMARGTASLSG